MSQTTLHIAEQDNVMVALRLIAGGTVVDGVTVASEVPAGHKIAIRPIPAGQTVLKYGYPIGVATRDIAPGEHVHSHNLTSTLRDDFDASKHETHLRKLPAPSSGDVRRLPARRRPGRHAQRALDRQHRRLREQRRRAHRRGGAQGAGGRRGGAPSTASTPSRTSSAARSSATISS